MNKAELMDQLTERWRSARLEEVQASSIPDDDELISIGWESFTKRMTKKAIEEHLSSFPTGVSE